jgi:hypothetical protein
MDKYFTIVGYKMTYDGQLGRFYTIGQYLTRKEIFNTAGVDDDKALEYALAYLNNQGGIFEAYKNDPKSKGKSAFLVRAAELGLVDEATYLVVNARP